MTCLPMTKNLRYFVGLDVHRGGCMVANLYLITIAEKQDIIVKRGNHTKCEDVDLFKPIIDGALCGVGTVDIILYSVE